jgi:hypothetical protein
MRSELVFGAMTHVQNRYLLARLTSKTTRIFHRPRTRLEETANHVLRLFSLEDPQQTQPTPSNSSREGTELPVHQMRQKHPPIAKQMTPGRPAAVHSNQSLEREARICAVSVGGRSPGDLN